MSQIVIAKDDAGYKVTVTKDIPQVEEFAYSSWDEAVQKAKEVEAAETPAA